MKALISQFRLSSSNHKSVDMHYLPSVGKNHFFSHGQFHMCQNFLHMCTIKFLRIKLFLTMYSELTLYILTSAQPHVL